MKRDRSNPFAVRLLQSLDEIGMTQKRLAELTGLTQESVSRYVCGDRIPRAVVAMRIADVLGVSVDYLCGRDTRKYKISGEDGKPDDLISRKAVLDAILGDGPPEPHYPSWYAERVRAIQPEYIRKG